MAQDKIKDREKYALIIPEVHADNLMSLDTTNFYYKISKPICNFLN